MWSWWTVCTRAMNSHLTPSTAWQQQELPGAHYLPVIVSSCPQWKEINSELEKWSVPKQKCHSTGDYILPKGTNLHSFHCIARKRCLGWLQALSRYAARDLQETAVKMISSSSPWQNQQKMFISTLIPVIKTLLNLNGHIFNILSS